MGAVSELVTIGPCTVHLPMAVQSAIRDARAVRVDQATVWVELSSGRTPPSPGTRVILDGPWAVRVLGSVASVEGRRFKVSVLRETPKDRRAAPRSLGGIDLEYVVVTSPAEVQAWIDRGERPVGRKWRVPDPFMSFSASGLRFEDAAYCEVGDQILLQLGVPKRGTKWRGAARTVRVAEIPAGEQILFVEDSLPATHRIAVHFEVLPDEARDALMSRGLEIARAISRSI